MKKINLLDIILVLIQTALSAALIYLLRNILPMKFLSIIIGILALLLLIVFYVLIVKQKAKWTTRITSILLSIILGLVVYVAKTGLGTLNNVTGSNTETDLFSVVVMDESSYEKMEDLDSQKFGLCALVDNDEYNEAYSAMTSSIQTEDVNYDSMQQLQEALYNGDVQAIVLNEAYRSTLEEIIADFSTDTRIIDSYEVEKKVHVNTATPTKSFDITKDSFNVFISGIDTYGPVNTVSRSDVNMIVTVNPTTKTILMTSIPRDYYVTLATSGQLDKLTHAGIYGVNESIQTLENLFSIDINYYARVNFTSLVTMVDALGGIQVYNPEAFQNGAYDYPVGMLDMDGAKALAFARDRYDLAGGDRSRVLNQQRVLTGMIEKATSSAIITNYSEVLSAVNGCIETNMSSEEIQSLISMQLNKMTGWHFKSQSVDGTGSSSTECYSYKGAALYVMIPDQDTVDAATETIKAIMEE